MEVEAHFQHFQHLKDKVTCGEVAAAFKFGEEVCV